jgi:hypothetical protein
MSQVMIRLVKLLFSCILVLFCLPALWAATPEDVSQYLFNSHSLAFTYPHDQIKNSVHHTDLKQEKKLSAFQVVFEYQDKLTDLLSPHHSYLSEFEPVLQKSSQEFKTHLDYSLQYLTPGAALKYSPDSYGKGRYLNYELGVKLPVKNLFSIETQYGWNLFENKLEKQGVKDYEDWSIGISTMYRGMKLKLDYIDVKENHNTEECSQLFPCESKTVFSIIKHF